MTAPNRFPDRFLPAVPAGDPGARAWAREEAARLPLAVLACLDPFTLRDRIALYEADQRRYPERGAQAAGLLLRATLDRAVAWQTQRTVARPDPERGQGGGER